MPRSLVRDNLRRSQASPWLVALVAFIILYGFAGTTAAVIRDRAMAATSEDTAQFDHLFWSILHGRFADSLVLHACHFGDHCSFLLLVLLPAYWAMPGPEVLFLAQSFALALCALPAFVLARDWNADEAAAFLVAVAVTMHPAVLSQNVNQIHAAQLGLPLLVWAALLYRREKFGLFMLACALACLAKENVAAAVFMFGPLAALKRRSWRWVFGPSLLSAGVLCGFVFVVAPALMPGGYRAAGYFFPQGRPEGLGALAAELAHRAMEPSRLAYVSKCLLSAGAVLPLLGPFSLVALPELLVNMTVSNGLFCVLHYHFSLTVGAFLTLGGAQAAARLSPRLGGKLMARALAGTLAAAAIAGNLFWVDARPFREPPWHAAQITALALVPDDPEVSVLAPHAMLSRVARRREVYYLDARSLLGKDVTDIDMVILCLNGLAPRANRRLADLMRNGAGARTHRLVFERDGMLVFARKDLPQRMRARAGVQLQAK